MKKEWKNIEGRLARIDVGSSLSEAMGSAFPAEAICFTTNGNIVFNGIQYSLSQDEYNALVEAIKAKVDKKEGYDLASQDQLRAAQWCSEHILMDNSSTSFLKVEEDGKNGYKFAHLVDGETYNSTPQYIPLATDTATGVMSASDHASFTEALEDIDTLFSETGEIDKAVTDNAEAIKANTEAIAKNATDIKACQDALVEAANTKSVLQISTSLVLPFAGISPFRITVEGIAKDAQWKEAYGFLPQYSSALHAFYISADAKNYLAWTNFTDIPDSAAYGSTKTLYYDGEKLYRYTGKELVELTSTSSSTDTTALEERVKTLETQLASVLSLLTLQE